MSAPKLNIAGLYVRQVTLLNPVMQHARAINYNIFSLAAVLRQLPFFIFTMTTCGSGCCCY
jgi:ABC-type maltose transport system permease subunit